MSYFSNRCSIRELAHTVILQRRTQGSTCETSPRGEALRGQRWLTLLVVLLVAQLSACAWTAPAAIKRSSIRSTPTPTTVPVGTVLFQSDWTHGLNGWQATKGWKVLGNVLESDTGNNALTIPYSPTRANYAIQVDIQ